LNEYKCNVRPVRAAPLDKEWDRSGGYQYRWRFSWQQERDDVDNWPGRGAAVREWI